MRLCFAANGAFNVTGDVEVMRSQTECVGAFKRNRKEDELYRL